MKEKSYSTAEKFLILVAIAIFGAMGYAYVNDISIKKLLFPSAEDRFMATPIGKSITVSGTALRQRASDFEFNQLTAGADLYPNDTLMTGPDSTMSIIINKDQKRIDLAPNSLVKLSFGQDSEVTGAVHLEVLKGDKDDEAGQEPLVVSNTLPEDKATLEFTPEEFAQRKKSVTIAYAVNRKTSRMTVHVFFPAAAGQPRREVSSMAASIEGLRASATFTFNSPGAYEWEVHDLQGKTLAKHTFQIPQTIRMIETLPTQNNNNRLDGLATKKVFDGFVLRWKAISIPGDYIVKVYKPGGGLILQKRMAATELVLNKNNLILGKLHYTVEKELADGFMATSARTDFGFEFLPPEPAAPAQGAFFDSGKLYQTNNILFFTWTKTNYTEAYQFEFATDPQFRFIQLSKTLKDNYFSHVAPVPGRYYWRVRSLSSGMWSDFSQVRNFAVTGN